MNRTSLYGHFLIHCQEHRNLWRKWTCLIVVAGRVSKFCQNSETFGHSMLDGFLLRVIAKYQNGVYNCCKHFSAAHMCHHYSKFQCSRKVRILFQALFRGVNNLRANYVCHPINVTAIRWIAKCWTADSFLSWSGLHSLWYAHCRNMHLTVWGAQASTYAVVLLSRTITSTADLLLTTSIVVRFEVMEPL